MIRIHTYGYKHMHIHTYIHTYIPACMHTYIHTYIHTHTHTYIHTNHIYCTHIVGRFVPMAPDVEEATKLSTTKPSTNKQHLFQICAHGPRRTQGTHNYYSNTPTYQRNTLNYHSNTPTLQRNTPNRPKEHTLNDQLRTGLNQTQTKLPGLN